MKTHTQNGNALFFILIAVVMLGLLTIVLSRGGSNTEQTGSFEQDRIQITQILRYVKSIEAAIEQMKLDGISENEISFANNITTADYTNIRCDDTSDRNFPRCLIFDQGGAGLTFRNFPSVNDSSDWTLTSVYNVGSINGPVGTTEDVRGNDIIMVLSNIDGAICRQINRDLGVKTSGTIPLENDFSSLTEFTGAFPTGLEVIDAPDGVGNNVFDSQTAGCFVDANTINHFYYVLLAR
ncbi:MAG: hypothetical protein AB8B83_04150 [Bdellovibrionales bacterium]